MKTMHNELRDMISAAKTHRVKAIQSGGHEPITVDEIREAEQALHRGNEKIMHIAINILKG